VRAGLAAARRWLVWLLTPITPGARRAVVFLFLLTLALAGANLLWTAHETAADDTHWHQAIVTDDHKFCAVIGGMTSLPVSRPADPARTPAQERQFEWYERFVSLGRSLGCP